MSLVTCIKGTTPPFTHTHTLPSTARSTPTLRPRARSQQSSSLLSSRRQWAGADHGTGMTAGNAVAAGRLNADDAGD
jgi:hypothetical protein